MGQFHLPSIPSQKFPQAKCRLLMPSDKSGVGKYAFLVICFTSPKQVSVGDYVTVYPQKRWVMFTPDIYIYITVYPQYHCKSAAFGAYSPGITQLGKLEPAPHGDPRRVKAILGDVGKDQEGVEGGLSACRIW